MRVHPPIPARAATARRTRPRSRRLAGVLLAAVAVAAPLPVTVTADAAGKPARAKAAVTVKASTPKPVARNHWATIRVTVTNARGGRRSGLTLAVAPAKAVGAKLSGARKGRLKRTLRTLKAHGHVTITLRLRPGGKATSPATAKLTVARRGRVQARGTAKVPIKGAAPPASGAPGAPAPGGPAAPAPPANPLVGRYFFKTTLIGTTMYYDTYYFANGGFAYRGRPSGGLPSCPAATAVGDDDGCIPYGYDPATGTVTIDGKTGSESASHQLSLDGTGYLEAVTPAAGTTMSTQVHTIQGAGSCAVSCVFSSGEYTFTADGQFALTTSVSGTSFAALPPTQHGTYEILDGGRLVLHRADGTAATKTIGFVLDDGRPNPNEWILLDGTIYWGPDSGV